MKIFSFEIPFCAFQLINRFILSRHQLFCLSHKLIICAYNVTENEEKFAHAPTKNFSAYFFLSVHFIAIVAAVLTIYFLKISRREIPRVREERKRKRKGQCLTGLLVSASFFPHIFWIKVFFVSFSPRYFLFNDDYYEKAKALSHHSETAATYKCTHANEFLCGRSCSHFFFIIEHLILEDCHSETENERESEKKFFWHFFHMKKKSQWGALKNCI